MIPGTFYLIFGTEKRVAMKSRVGAYTEAEEMTMKKVKTC